jgi:murein DD-endopeptidase MepM/ murein hydrolase activator NlpD
MNEGFILQVLRPAGAAICRLHFRRRHLVFAGILVASLLAGLYALHVHQLQTASATVARLRAERADQERKLDVMEQQTQELQRATIESERSIEKIERTLGTPPGGTSAKVSRIHAAIERVQGAGDAALALKLQSLARSSAEAQAQAEHLAGLVKRVLSFRRMALIVRARVLAAIPSLNPTGGTVNAAFGWRTDPFPEFHKGLDLAADYGAPVHASAAGIVASAGWEGGFGNKIDIDHGNGYHTWYCHLSHIEVAVGQRVSRGQSIAAAGSTGESTGPHLHYQVMHDGVAIDPMPFLHGVPHNILATLPRNPGVQ